MKNENTVLKHSVGKDLQSFRSELQSTPVGTATLKATDLMAQRSEGISQFRLEQFLNACNPSCSG
jgi:hypothetical protein